jgi:hypothetical protein
MIHRILMFMAALAAALSVHAADSRRYAVLSLVGDRILVVEREMSTGSRLDRNHRIFVDVPDQTLDKSMLLAIDDAIRQKDPGAITILLTPNDPALYAAAARELDGTGNTQRIYESVKSILVGTNATHLVLVTKQRHAAKLKLRDGMVGTGYLEGLGFYVDYGTFARAVDTNEAERGFIAPFTYVNVALIEVKTGKVISEERVTGSAPYTTPSINIGNAWGALTPQEKADRLADVMRSEADRVVPQLLARS